ncbi:helix-hairpin-helix domain-containing protein [Brachybacterium sp. GPGPB12]
MDHREQNGPFESVDQLEEVSGIGPATLEKMRDRATV